MNPVRRRNRTWRADLGLTGFWPLVKHRVRIVSSITKANKIWYLVSVPVSPNCFFFFSSAFYVHLMLASISLTVSSTTERYHVDIGWKGPIEVTQRKACPAFLFKQNHQEQTGQDYVQTTCEQLYKFSGQSVPLFGHPHREKCFSTFSDITCCATVCAHCLLFCHWETTESR